MEVVERPVAWDSQAGHLEIAHLQRVSSRPRAAPSILQRRLRGQHISRCVVPIASPLQDNIPITLPHPLSLQFIACGHIINPQQVGDALSPSASLSRLLHERRTAISQGTIWVATPHPLSSPVNFSDRISRRRQYRAQDLVPPDQTRGRRQSVAPRLS